LLLVPKGAKKTPREISVPTARDRIVLRALADLIIELFPSSRGEIPQSKVYSVSKHLSLDVFDTYIRIDIENFYPSIKHDRVFQLLGRKIRKKVILKAIKDALETPTVADGHAKLPASVRNTIGVPQGLAISNPLAELILAEIDESYSKRTDMAYTRFVDDVLILCKSGDAAVIEKEFLAELSASGLKAHPMSKAGDKSTSGPVTDGFAYLGYVFRPQQISVRPSSVTRLESSLARSFTRYKKSVEEHPQTAKIALARCKWQVDLTITGCFYKGAARGWLQYYRQMDDYTLLKQLDATVARFASRFQMPAQFDPKKFMRAYWEIRHPRPGSSYIPNFDNFETDDKRNILRGHIRDVDSMSTTDVDREFFAFVDKAVSRLEHDIGLTS